MDGAAAGVAGLNWDRFAGWQTRPARLALLALVLLILAAALAPIHAGPSTVSTRGLVENMTDPKAASRKRDEDLALYDRAVERVRGGENYYEFIAEEHRNANYPLRPGLAVRLPTLAYISAWLGHGGLIAAALVLVLATIVAWWRRLSEEPLGASQRRLAMALLLLGVSLGLNRHFFALHELWSGMLLALAFGLHRPLSGKWVASLAVAALALAIREHALPFVALMAALALAKQRWKEGLAWTALAMAFLALIALHLQVVSQHVLPTDRMGADWLVWRGLSGWLSNEVLSSNLRFLPHWLAGPLVILSTFGWTGWKAPAGVFGSFLFIGYGVAFMAAGRADNYYWGAMVVPAMLVGLAFAPMALSSLIKVARRKVIAR